MKTTVIVVPETEDFVLSTSHENEIYINKNAGKPKLDERNTKYAAPFWLNTPEKGARRVYHIVSALEADNCTVLTLGNSFILSGVWNNMGNNRKFEYHPLDSFGLIEIKEGLLMKVEE